MKWTAYSIIFLLGLTLWVRPGSVVMAQGHEYIYDHFNISNGLISDNVYKIHVDKEGFAWIVTYNGLQMYNGYGFETFTSHPDRPGSITSNFVDNIFEDRQGDLIVVLEDGIDVFNKEKHQFSNLLKDLPFTQSPRNEISRLSSAVQDPSGSIWVNCNNRLIRIDPNKRHLVLYPEDYRGRFVINRDSTLLWFITDRSIKCFDLDKRQLTITNLEQVRSPVSVDDLNALYCDSEHLIWVGTSSGLFLLDEDRSALVDPFQKIPRWRNADASILSQNITSIYEDFHHNLWVASGSSLQRIVRSTGEIQTLQHEVDNLNSLLDEQITGIHGNQSGVVWVTYLNEGFTRINLRMNNFSTYRTRSNHKMSLGGNTVRSICKDPKGIIWVGLYNDGLDRIDRQKGVISHFRHDPDDDLSICSNYIASLCIDTKGRLWVGSHDQGLCYSDQVYGETLRFQRAGFLNSSEEIYHLLEDAAGRIWIGTRNGLGLYNYERDEFQWVLENHNVQSFLIDQRTIWIASWNHGLCKLQFEEGQFESDHPRFDTASSIIFTGEEYSEAGRRIINTSQGRVQNGISIYQDDRKNIWLGTYDRGLVKVRETGDEISFAIYDRSHGAPGNAIYGMAGDQEGNIWISTEHGIGKFDPDKELFENYYREDGLLSNYFMWKAYYEAGDGEILFGTVDGLNTFYPEEIIKDSLTARAFVSDVMINNRRVECGDTVNGEVLLARHITFQDTLILNHRNRNFSFDFCATGHVNPQELTYSYTLVGYDDHWITLGSGSRDATYTNIPAGTYLFRVRADDTKAKWIPEYDEKMVVVLPPWWKTRFAFAVYFIFITGLIALIANSLIRFLKLKSELLYNERLHQSKLMFFTNVSHEFKTPLSLIKSPLDDILHEEELSPHNRKNLLVARKNATSLLDLVNELMEFRRTDAGISKLKAEHIELQTFIKETIVQFEYLAEQAGVHFYYDVPDEPISVWVDRKKFGRIIKNLLENALKYTKEEGLVTLSVISDPSTFRFKPNYHTLQLNHIRTHSDYFGILVSDTGVGISRESLPRIFERFYQIEAEKAGDHIGSGIGLALVKNLVLLHYGEIRVASERGLGTEILVLLPKGSGHLKKEELITAVEPTQDSDILNQEHPGKTIKPVVQPGPSGHRGIPTVLLVEDHNELRQYLKDQLSGEFRIMEAMHGREAIRILHENRIDLVVSDWIMPVMDGTGLIREIRSDERLSTLPVILLTARDEMKDLQEGLETGADLVIPKPFNMHLLKSQVRRTIENQRRRQNRFSLENLENMAEVHENREAHFMSEVDRIIRKHMRDSDLNAGMIAKELGVSRTALYDKFRAVTGQSIGEHIQRVRLKQAIRLMLYENVTVSEVYIMVGFNSSSYLIKLFRKYYQTTPREYIKAYLKKASN